MSSGQIFSVWNQPAGMYDYYRSSQAQLKANTPKPNHLKPTKLGLTVNQAAWPLPAGAKKIGRGQYPHGRIATLSREPLGVLPDLSSPMTWIAAGAIAYFAIKQGWIKL